MRARSLSTLAAAAFVACVAAPHPVQAQTPANKAPLSLPIRPAFHVTVGFAHAGWSDAALSAADGFSLSASRHFAGPVQVSFNFASLSGNTLSGTGVAAARHYLVDAAVGVAPELALRGHLVEPQVGVGIGTVATAPAADSLSTRSQNAWELNAGVDVGVRGPFTVGVRYRRVAVRLEDVAATGPTVPGTWVRANVVSVRLGIRF